MQFYIAIPRILSDLDDEHLFIDENANNVVDRLAAPINAINPPEDGEYNKDVCILSMARAYVKYLQDNYDNNRFMNPGSYFLICTRIAKHVN